jgi:type I restriction enzyme S subunit
MFGRFVENDLGDGIVSHIFDVYRPIYRDINITFWKYYINSEKVMHNVLRKSTTSATMMHNLVSKDFLNQTLLIPSNNESAKIGLIESKIDNLITLQQRKLELLKLMKSIISYNLVVSHKLTSNNKSEWKVAYLKDIAKIYQPTTITKKDLVPKGIPVFGANDYIGFYNTSNHTTDQVTICARGASAGNPNYVKAPVWITGNSMVINVDGVHINKKFLYTLLKFTNLKRFVTGGAQPQITRENLNSLKILLPSIEVQNSLSVLIEKLSINIKKTKTSIHSAKKLKQFLLQNMFI